MGTYIGVAIVLIAFGIIILLGKGDGLIAGFNTASKEEKDKFDTVKLRRLVGIFLLFIGVIMVPMGIIIDRASSAPAALADAASSTSSIAGFIFSGTVIVLAGIVIILANTWAKKK